MSELLAKYLNLSKKIRPNYIESLGEASSSFVSTINNFWNGSVPEVVLEIYSQFKGTKREVKNQKLMDFIPGYRLIHISELSQSYEELRNRSGRSSLFPLLANYSSDFICIENNVVFLFSNDDVSLSKMHLTVDDFFKTLCVFYEDEIYFLDDDGYLDYDFEREGKCGLRLNENVDYWME